MLLGYFLLFKSVVLDNLTLFYNKIKRLLGSIHMVRVINRISHIFARDGLFYFVLPKFEECFLPDQISLEAFQVLFFIVHHKIHLSIYKMCSQIDSC